MLNPMLLALMEEAAPKFRRINEASDDENNDSSTEDTNDNSTDDTGGEEEETSDDNNQEEENKEDENQDEEQSEEEGEEDDPFGFDSDEEDDGEPNPDGLPDPDDEGEEETEESDEKNVQTNILNISDLDRHLVKKRLFDNFKDLRTSVNSFKMTIDDREEALTPEIRNAVINQLGDLYEKLTEYLMYKFSYINYEENLENFLLYTKKFNEIIKIVSADDKHDNKRAKKKSSSKKSVE